MELGRRAQRSERHKTLTLTRAMWPLERPAFRQASPGLLLEHTKQMKKGGILETFTVPTKKIVGLCDKT